MDLHIYGGDPSEAFSHSLGQSALTFVSIDDQFSDLYRHKFRKNINWYKVLSVFIYVKGHPESGRLWEYLINKILKHIGFTTTFRDRNIYRSIYKPTEENIYLLRQSSDFALACSN